MAAEKKISAAVFCLFYFFHFCIYYLRVKKHPLFSYICKRGNAMKREFQKQLILLVFLLLVLTALLNFIRQRSRASLLNADTCFTEDFREQALSPRLYAQLEKETRTDGEFADFLTATMLNERFYPKKLSYDNHPYLRFKKDDYIFLKDCYSAVWSDLETFPIPARAGKMIQEEISYENTFGAKREFGGNRTHEGCDLFGRISEPGFYPVISMTSGSVAKIGWLPLGGYRIGIRAPHGGYFYYAHLASYEKSFQIGEQVEAGQILGYMGNTGYGEEGTLGRFPVHLHLGIYIESRTKEELSVNPYYILQTMEKKAKKYTY